MTIGQQLDALKAGLQSLAGELGASLAVAADQGDFIKAIENNPTGLTFTVIFAGETAADPDNTHLVVWRNFRCVVCRPYAHTLTRGDNLTGESSGVPPLFGVVESVRNSLLNVALPDQDDTFQPKYTGTEVLDMGELPMDAWLVNVTLGANMAEDYREG